MGQCKQLDICDGFHQHNFKTPVHVTDHLPEQPPIVSQNRNHHNLSMQP